MAQTPEAELLAQLRHASRLLEEILCECYSPLGIGTTRVDVLELLAGTLECCSQSLLARQLGLSESTVCTLIDRMQVDGLLVRQRSVTDRRRSVLAVSDLGLRLLQDAASRREERLRSAFRDWTAAEQGTVFAGLQELIATLQKSLEQAPAVPRLQERAA